MALLRPGAVKSGYALRLRKWTHKNSGTTYSALASSYHMIRHTTLCD